MSRKDQPLGPFILGCKKRSTLPGSVRPVLDDRRPNSMGPRRAEVRRPSSCRLLRFLIPSEKADIQVSP